MCNVIMSTLLALVAAAHAKMPTVNHTTDMQDSIDKLADQLADKLVGQTLSVEPVYYVKLDDAMLGKPGHQGVPCASHAPQSHLHPPPSYRMGHNFPAYGPARVARGPQPMTYRPWWISDAEHRESPCRLGTAVAAATTAGVGSGNAGNAVTNRWFNPITEFGPVAGSTDKGNAPLLLYLPGIHGSALTPVVQFSELATVFEIQCLEFYGGDRSTLEEIQANVKARVREAKAKGREVYMVGESFGGIVALSLVMDDSDPAMMPDRVLLVNAASSFDRTLLGKLSPMLIKVPEPFFSLTMVPVLFQLFDIDMFRALGKAINGQYFKVMDGEGRKAFVGKIWPKILSHLARLRSDDIKWRIQEWILPGCMEVNQKLKDVKVPVLTVAGTVDNLIPSKEEALKFQGEIPDCTVHLVEGAGHAGILDIRTDLLDVIRSWVGSNLGSAVSSERQPSRPEEPSAATPSRPEPSRAGVVAATPS